MLMVLASIPEFLYKNKYLYIGSETNVCKNGLSKDHVTMGMITKGMLTSPLQYYKTCCIHLCNYVCTNLYKKLLCSLNKHLSLIHI